MTELVEVGRWNTRNPVYHTTDCSLHPEHTTTWTKEDAEAFGLRECKYCSGEHERPKTGNTEIYEAAVNWEPDQ